MIERVLDQIVLDDGSTVQVRDRPAQGTRHEILFGSLEQTGEPVVIKLERIPGALTRERDMLTWLDTEHCPAPRLLAAGAAEIDGQRVACLIIARRPGVPPRTAGGWRRMGRALGRLPDLHLPSSGIPIQDSSILGQQHAQRVSAWRPSREELRWWMTVAGIQFIHYRWQLDGQPAPWEEAADVLRCALTDDAAWSAG